MGKSAPKPPAPPDPAATAAAQTGSNINTAVANTILANQNQYTPYGNLTYNHTGYSDVGGYNVPTFSVTQTLNPSDQALLDKTGRLENQAADVGSSLFNSVQGNLSRPLDYSGAPQLSQNYDALRNSVYDASMSRVNQDFQTQQAQERQRLANQGIAEGTEASNAVSDNLQRARTDAANQAWIGAGNQADQAFTQEMARRNQGIQEINALRNAPINEISGLFGIGPGVQQPQFQQYQGGQVAPTDVQGAYNSAFQAQNANYQAQVAQRNAAKGGLGSLIGTGAGLAFRSDRRVKTDIRKVGRLDNGLPVFIFRYKEGGPLQIGVMAQDVEKKHPDAVIDIGGVLHVFYEKAVQP